jgi:ribosomal protein S18 acetylase RimI-like enzyme
MDGISESPITIRSYVDADRADVLHLYEQGRLGGQNADNDTGFDIDDIGLAYLSSPGAHFWVAITETGQVVGMIGVQQHEPGVGEIRRLRVHSDFRRRRIGSRLLQAALEFCRSRGILKVTLDTYIDREPALRLFEKFHFRHERTRESQGKQLLFFYLDIYGSEKKSP